MYVSPQPSACREDKRLYFYRFTVIVIITCFLSVYTLIMIVFFSVKDGEGSEDGFDDDDSLSDWNLSKYTVCSTTKVKGLVF